VAMPFLAKRSMFSMKHVWFFHLAASAYESHPFSKLRICLQGV
jgi:hypothetical protein